MRSLTELEQSRIALLTKNQVSLTLIEPTQNGLTKSIMDATASVRNFLLKEKIHNYNEQKQGPINKVLYPAKIYIAKKVLESKASLYRPSTKNGDPRIWFYKLTSFANANDLIAIIPFQNCLHIFNLTQIDIENLLSSKDTNPLKELISQINLAESKVANELLLLLKKIAAKGPIPSMVNADTSVGRTLETLLGININSSMQPDFKGIELKSFRGKKNNRKNLFAQVPNWSLSKFKSSAEILDTFGYYRERDFKLYCTVSTINKNSQGLSLRIDTEIEQLVEYSDDVEINDFVVWTLAKLHSRLAEKHGETFWVEADSIIEDGKEYFQYSIVEHTKGPIISQFDLLLQQGIITVDHLIKRNSKGKVIEKGPLFKIRPKGIGLLFPPSGTYNLLQ